MKLVNIEIIKDELERLIRNYRFYSSAEAKFIEMLGSLNNIVLPYNTIHFTIVIIHIWKETMDAI